MCGVPQGSVLFPVLSPHKVNLFTVKCFLNSMGHAVDHYNVKSFAIGSSSPLSGGPTLKK